MVNATVTFVSTEVFCTPVLFSGLAHSTESCWAISDIKGMPYLSKKKSPTKQAYIEHKFYKKCKASLVRERGVLLHTFLKMPDFIKSGSDYIKIR